NPASCRLLLDIKNLRDELAVIVMGEYGNGFGWGQPFDRSDFFGIVRSCRAVIGRIHHEVGDCFWRTINAIVRTPDTLAQACAHSSFLLDLAKRSRCLGLAFVEFTLRKSDLAAVASSAYDGNFTAVAPHAANDAPSCADCLG